MTLTGPVFLALLIALTTAAFVVAVVLMPRLPGRRLRPLAARVALLVIVNLSVVLTAGAILNNQYTFYADWTDLSNALFGADPPATTAQAGQSLPSTLAAHPTPTSAGKPASQPSAATPVPRLPASGGTGRLRTFTVTGPRSGLTGTILVGLPADYTDAANSTQYPILETFHGYPGTVTQWPEGMHLTSTLDTEVTQGRMAPVITISPTIEFPGGIDTECVDAPGGNPKVETWLTQDVPDWVRAHLQVRPDRTAWATIGLSSGAWCAAMATMLHPNRYAAAIVMGGYFRPHFSANYQPFTASSALGQRYDLITLAAHAPPPVALWVQTSHADPFSYPSTTTLLANARAPLSVHALILQHAGHREGIWIDELPTALQWLANTLPGFQAAKY